MPTNTGIERPLPHNLEAERSILGAVLLDNHALNAAVEQLRSEDFFLPQHRHIFERMVQLGEKQQAIDTITLMEDLARSGALEAAGGVAYLSQLADGLPRATNVDHYARIVKEKAILRSLIYSASAIQEQALAAGDDADVILDRAESTIFQLAEDRVKAGLIGVKDLVKESFDRLEKIFSEGRRITGLATGYAGLDNETAGLQPSELIILAARPSMGKTALALNMAENVALRHREPVAIFSLEMSKESLLLRLLGVARARGCSQVPHGTHESRRLGQGDQVAGGARRGAHLDRRFRVVNSARNGSEGAAAEARSRTFTCDCRLHTAGGAYIESAQ